MLLDIAANYHRIKFKGILMNQTWENCKKLNFGPNCDPFGFNLPKLRKWQKFYFPNLDSKHFVQEFYLYYVLDIAACNFRENQWSKLKKMVKNLIVGPDLGPVSPIFGLQKVLFKNLASSVSRYHGQLSCTISEKANDPFLRKLSGRRTEGQTERRTRMIP